ncbi:hypothetical protein AJ80_05871 [Polytolypa hystricis UAMH7299]|uniref:TOM core complex subunit Tom6 n=1 Tax=Polytolypa hystricis (strain UAMH7299) TaxID=1447883 RepID=A0A2B7Y0J5_POLH7|nr:hypothetical protein AJ80_05871 [Polytolypa hystricis UAMH7299]
MPPKQRAVAARYQPDQRGLLASAYSGLTSPDNATVVRSVLVFGAAVAFLHSSFSELLLPA